MSARLHFIVEGQTEETFVNIVLAPELARHEIWANARCVMTSRKHGVKRRGGLRNYAKAKNDIVLWMKEDDRPDSFFTTMFDLYALPQNFPGCEDAAKRANPYERVATLEKAIGEDIGHPRFVPYIQLHEFEALIFSDPIKLEMQFFERDAAIKNLAETASRFETPELIDDGAESAPSKRIIDEIPEYAGMKASAGPLVVQEIGLSILCAKCAHFAEWLDKLKALSARA